MIAGRIRPLDDLTRQLLLSWLEYRAERWPNTANPHLLINQQTAMETGAVSTFWAKRALQGQPATLERLRVDRQLEEALTHGPEPFTGMTTIRPKPAVGLVREPPGVLDLIRSGAALSAAV